MKPFPRNLIVTAATLTVLGSALAGPVYDKTPPPIPPAIPAPEPVGGGLYVSLFGGVNFADNHNSQFIDDCGCTFDLDWDKDTGGYGGIEIGYATAWSTGFAMMFEVEGFYNGYDVNATGSDYGFRVADGTTSVRSYNLMFNAIARYDFGRFGLFAGAGVGYYDADIDHDKLSLGSHNFHTQQQLHIDDGLAWQLIGGADFQLTENTDIYTEYRYLVYETDFEFSGFEEQHLLGAGIRYHW